MTYIYKTIKENATIILFFTFIVISYLKCILFEHVVYSEINTHFLSSHLSKIIISIFIGSPILLLKKKSTWYAIILSLIIDIWIFANFIYFRHTESTINALSLTLIGNMDGFWNSIFLFIKLPTDILPFLFSCTLIPFLFIENKKIEIPTFICAMISLYPLAFLSHYIDISEKQYWNPKLRIEPTNFYKVTGLIKHESSDNLLGGIAFRNNERSLSAIHNLINELIILKEVKKENQTTIKLTSTDINELKEYGFQPDISESKKFHSKLIIILIESMESWVLNKNTMPNLSDFMEKHNYIYASKVVSQIREGSSADGQLIINTGLLPIYNGATCYRYPNNTYPAISKLAKGKSLCMLPHKLDVWNQVGMSAAYGYTNNVCLNEDDSILFSELIKYIEEGEYQVIQLLTLSTHANFESVAWKSKFTPDPDMPLYEQNYLKSFHYVDEQMGKFLSKIDTCEAFKDLTIVITGDHTIFPKDKRDELMEYSKSHNNTYNPEEYTCALILSNKLDKQIRIDHVSYQMDIYPTLTSLLECGYKNYKGIGKNLLERNFTPQEIKYDNELKYSNLIISSNYFGLNND